MLSWKYYQQEDIARMDERSLLQSYFEDHVELPPFNDTGYPE